MKRSISKKLPVMLLAALLLASGTVAVGCSSEKTMYERKQTNKGTKVKSNIKVRGSNKSNGHTTRSY